MSTREARIELAEVRHDRSYKGPGSSNHSGGTAKDKAKASVGEEGLRKACLL